MLPFFHTLRKVSKPSIITCYGNEIIIVFHFCKMSPKGRRDRRGGIPCDVLMLQEQGGAPPQVNLQVEMATMMATLNNIQTNIQQNREQVQEVNNELDQIRNPLQPLENHAFQALDPQEQRRIQVGAKIAKEFKNYSLSKFSGRDTNYAQNWIIELEAYFIIKGFTIYAKTTVACQHLSEFALEWWNTFLTSTLQIVNDVNCQKFLRIFWERFLTLEFYKKKREEFLLLTQVHLNMEV